MYIQMCEVFKNEKWVKAMKEATRTEDKDLRIKLNENSKIKTPLIRYELFCELCNC